MKVIVVAGSKEEAESHVRNHVEPAGIPQRAVVVVTPATGISPARGLRGCTIEYGPGFDKMRRQDLRFLAMHHPAK